MNMFGQMKPTASLSSTLLARKGTAKPAMRPQGFGGFGSMPGAQDDLGWNDMGHDPAPVEATPSAPLPPVLIQREMLHEEFAEPVVMAAPAPKSVSVATATRIGRDAKKNHTKRHPKSAFTLRLDQDRHFRLRLASALQNASAQALVTQALDQFLQSLPEVEDLVRQIPTRASR
jgi:hypothetical protein